MHRRCGSGGFTVEEDGPGPFGAGGAGETGRGLLVWGRRAAGDGGAEEGALEAADGLGDDVGDRDVDVLEDGVLEEAAQEIFRQRQT